jgi:hypothetical protein
MPGSKSPKAARRRRFGERTKRALAILACIGMLGGAGAIVLWQLVGRQRTETGIAADKPTELLLTCVNPDCPGRQDEEDPRTLQTIRRAPYRFYTMLPGNFTDWPVPCPKCVQQFGPDYVTRIDREEFRRKYRHDPGQGELRGRSAFHIQQCIECGTRWVVRDVTKMKDFRCPNPNCVSNAGRQGAS